MHCSHCEREIKETWMMKAWDTRLLSFVYFHLKCYEKNAYWASNFVMGATQVKSSFQEPNFSDEE